MRYILFQSFCSSVRRERWSVGILPNKQHKVFLVAVLAVISGGQWVCALQRAIPGVQLSLRHEKLALRKSHSSSCLFLSPRRCIIRACLTENHRYQRKNPDNDKLVGE